MTYHSVAGPSDLTVLSVSPCTAVVSGKHSVDTVMPKARKLVSVSQGVGRCDHSSCTGHLDAVNSNIVVTCAVTTVATI